MSTRNRLTLAQADAEDIEIPAGPLISRQAEAAPAEKGREGEHATPAPQSIRKPVASATNPPIIEERAEMTLSTPTVIAHSDTNIMQLATSAFTPSEIRVKTSLSLPASLDNLLNNKVMEMKMRGFRKMTREAVVEQALKQYFGVE